MKNSEFFNPEMAWKKYLYLQQDWPMNYMETNIPQKERDVKETYEDINRAAIRISVTTIGFCLFKLVYFGDGSGISETARFSLISVFIENFFENEGRFCIRLKPGILLLVFVYLLSPMIRTLTTDMDSNTVYVYFIITQFFFSVDSVRTSIYNNRTPVKTKDALTPLSIQESTNITKKIFSNNILGLTACFIGYVLLSSQLEDPASVFDLLCLTFIGHIILPKHLERLEIHRKFSTTMILHILVSTISLLLGTTIFYLHSFIVAYLYSVSHISILLLEKDLECIQ